MVKIITALLFGYLLIALEAIVPGGVLGLLGFTCIIASSYFAHIEYGGWVIPLCIFIIGGIGGVILVFLQFKWLSRSNFGKKMFVHSTSGKVSSKEDLSELIGKEAMTLTDHHPEGLVEINNRSYDAFSSSGYIPKGSVIEITGVDAFRLIIKPL